MRGSLSIKSRNFQNIVSISISSPKVTKQTDKQTATTKASIIQERCLQKGAFHFEQIDFIFYIFLLSFLTIYVSININFIRQDAKQE